jgi:hypothetical protein
LSLNQKVFRLILQQYPGEDHMDFIDHIRDLSARIQKQASSIQTEEATKNAFVMPFMWRRGACGGCHRG